MPSKESSNTQVIFKYIPSLSKCILAIQCIWIRPFQSPMNPLAFKLCASTLIHSNKVHFNSKMLSRCQMSFLDSQITQVKFYLPQIKALALKYALELSKLSSYILFTSNKSTSFPKCPRTLQNLNPSHHLQKMLPCKHPHHTCDPVWSAKS